MKPTTINVQITKCPKQYEAVRLGMECTIDSGETVESAIKAATEQLTAIYEGMINPQAKPAAATAAPAAPAPEPAKEPTRERLEFGDKRVQQIVRRMEKTPEKAQDIMAQTLKYFEPTEEVLNVLKLAAKIV
jgi:hypothetical protein